MKKLIFLVLFFSVSTTLAFAQFKFGDIEISTMEEIFNPDNENLWGKKKMGGTYKFKDQNSEIWTENEFSGLIVKNKYVKQNSANFSAALKYEQNSLIERITSQLNEQFGEFEKVEYDNSALGGGKTEMLKWTYEEDDNYMKFFLEN
ncbi:MAG: hypothetical protein WD512_06750 [Candidatus Paceibacterota bacterium]